VATVIQPDGRVLVAENARYAYPPSHDVVRRLTSTGAPDLTFGVSGELDPQLGDGVLTSMALQPDGRVLLAGRADDGSLVVARRLSDGAPDHGFGSDGRIVISPGADARPTLSLQPDGGIVLTARRGDRVVVGRLTPEGRLDPSFGGGGLAPLEFGRAAWADQVLPAYLGVPAVTLADGRIRVGLPFTAHGEGVYPTAIVGLTPSGHPDTSFGRLGLAIGQYPDLPSYGDVVPLPGGETPAVLVRDARGGMLVVSSLWSMSDADSREEHRTVVRRFGRDGAPDRSFGRMGAVGLTPTLGGYTVIQHAAAIMPDDRLLLATHSFDGKYQWNDETKLRALDAGYDDEDPAISLVAGCRYLRIRVRDVSALDAVVVRAGGHIIRRTSAKRVRVRVPRRVRRLSVTAIDLARHTSRVRTRLPRCTPR
jgi:uncharacterized delta-60 repeat protein